MPRPEDPPLKPCPLCGGGLRRQFEKFGYWVLLCPACDTAVIDPMPSEKDLKGYYSLDYFKGNRAKFGYSDYAAEAACLKRAFSARAQTIRSFIPKGRILDVGCANGAFLAALGPEWEKHGVEISPEILEDSPPPKDVKVFTGDFLDYPGSPGLFDVATLFDLLDHVRDPQAVLRKAAGLLRPGGLLAVQQGDRSSLFARALGRCWHIYIPPTHLWYFSRAGLSRLIERQGLKVVRCEYEPRWASLSLCLFRLSYILPAFLVDPVYRLVKGTRIGELSVRFNFRDFVTLYARKGPA
ncbi:MAG: class I SAM-dependent methyltransferase [Elusimicrobia bacterium]|nr:class I SAM-dependent methyltransferase [Elusimicrobiota bacterium]